MGEFIYVPATGLEMVKRDSANNKLLTEMFNFGDSFIYDDSPFLHKHFLISYYYGRAMDDMKKDCNISDDVFVLGDSGGFQNVTQEANLDPLKVLEWQEKNCNAGLILDRPPFKRTEMGKFGGNVDREFFKKCLDETTHNGKLMLQKWSNPNFNLYGVIQGDTFEKQQLWFKQMLKLEKDAGRQFGGWALSPKPSTNVEQIAMHVGNLLEKDMTNKPVHILQISGHETLVVSAYASKFFDTFITVDSSTWAQQGKIYAEYFDPYHFKNKFYFTQKSDLKVCNGLCICPVCSRIDIKNLWKNDDNKSLSGSLIALHNLYHIIKFSKYLNGIKDDEKEFREFCHREFGNKLDYIFDYIKAVAGGMPTENAYAIYIKKSSNLFTYINDKQCRDKTEPVTPSIKKTSDDYLDEVYKEFPTMAQETAMKIVEHRIKYDSEVS